MRNLLYFILDVLVINDFANLFTQVFSIPVTVAQEPKLDLTPSVMNQAVGKNVYVSCMGNVPQKELISEMKWFDPNGNEITTKDDG